MSVSAVSAGTVASTEYPVIVNGFLCFSAADVRAARTWVDPSAADAAVETEPAATAMTASDQPAAATNPWAADEAARGVNQPLASGTRGTLVNILA